MCVCSTYGHEQTYILSNTRYASALEKTPKGLIKTGKITLSSANEPFNTGDCLMLVAFKTGLTILGSSLDIDNSHMALGRFLVKRFDRSEVWKKRTWN